MALRQEASAASPGAQWMCGHRAGGRALPARIPGRAIPSARGGGPALAEGGLSLPLFAADADSAVFTFSFIGWVGK